MIEVRPFTSSDNPKLSKIYLECRLVTFHWLPREQFQLADFEKDTEGESILVLTNNLVPIGFIAIWMPDHFIHHLFIDPNHQGKGHGKVLLSEGLKIIGKPARLKCVVQNSRACKFYERNGWRIESTTPDGPMGSYHTYTLNN